MLVEEGVGLLHDHAQAGRALFLPVDLGMNVAEEIGIVEAAPAGVGPAHRHAGVGDRGHQLRPVLVHVGVQLRRGHLEVDWSVGLQVTDADQEPLQVSGILCPRILRWAPPCCPLFPVVVVDLLLDLGPPVEQGPVAGFEFLHQLAKEPEHALGGKRRSGGYLVADEIEKQIVDLNRVAGGQFELRHFKLQIRG